MEFLFILEIAVPEFHYELNCALLAQNVHCKQMTEKVGRFLVSIKRFSFQEELTNQPYKAAEIFLPQKLKNSRDRQDAVLP
jgi:hypothetical protein